MPTIYLLISVISIPLMWLASIVVLDSGATHRFKYGQELLGMILGYWLLVFGIVWLVLEPFRQIMMFEWVFNLFLIVVRLTSVIFIGMVLWIQFKRSAWKWKQFASGAVLFWAAFVVFALSSQYASMRTLEIQVVDTSGKPAPGVKVTCTSDGFSPWSFKAHSARLEYSSKTNRDGVAWISVSKFDRPSVVIQSDICNYRHVCSSDYRYFWTMEVPFRGIKAKVRGGFGSGLPFGYSLTMRLEVPAGERYEQLLVYRQEMVNVYQSGGLRLDSMLPLAALPLIDDDFLQLKAHPPDGHRYPGFVMAGLELLKAFKLVSEKEFDQWRKNLIDEKINRGPDRSWIVDQIFERLKMLREELATGTTLQH